ncbi:HAD hydrolase family protein [Peribacillus frigoritolerans]|uniref:HAD hydrolase family protein n=1 Tax=Peribacillus frigoritolerans TaxID=450367 RepID=UPI003F7E176B
MLRKGAVKQLARKLGIQKEEIMVIGDNYNYIPMFESAGVSVAMGNANEISSRVLHIQH